MALSVKERPRSPDYAGQETLRRMADVDQYNAWIDQLIRPYLGRRIVEVGCGIGNMTPYFLQAELLWAFDLLPESAAWVGAKFAGQPHVRVAQGDVSDPAFINRLAAHRFDTVVSINMLEHVRHDRRALAQMYRLLGDRGTLVLFVPAGSYLYGSLDVALGHYRRYDRAGLARRVRAVGFRIEKLHYVNLLGIAGWLLNSRILRRRLLPTDQLRAFNLIAPLLRRLEARVPPPIGQSLLCIARKG